MTQITKAALLVRVEALEKSLKREVGERKRLEKALTDSLEQQTATSDILPRRDQPANLRVARAVQARTKKKAKS
jgi:hypothetical protein